MTRTVVLKHLRGQTDELRERFGVKKLFLFGSVARGEAVDNSDVDILVEFEGRASFDRFMGLKCHLEDLLGVRVDLVTHNALRPALRARVEREAIHAA